MKKILIIRFSSIGDIVLTTPVIRCIKKQLKSEVHYVTKNSFASILENNPHVDKVYSIETKITEILDDLKSEEYDFLVDLHHNLRSLRLKKALGKPSSSFPKLNIEKFFLTNFKLDRIPDVHIVDRYFAAAKKLGIHNDKNGLDFFIPKEDNVELQELAIPEKYIVFAIGAQYATKRLPNEKIIEIINGIDQAVVLIGGPTDTENAKIIEKNSAAINLTGQLNINQSASVIKQSLKVISHDTGMMHIAVALGKEVISIWGNTVPKLGMYPYYPENPELYSIHEVELKCRPCSKIGYQDCPKKHFKCMANQDSAAIIATVNNK